MSTFIEYLLRMSTINVCVNYSKNYEHSQKSLVNVIGDCQHSLLYNSTPLTFTRIFIYIYIICVTDRI